MENNTQLKEMIRSMVIDVLQGQKQENASSESIKQAPRGQVNQGYLIQLMTQFEQQKQRKLALKIVPWQPVKR